MNFDREFEPMAASRALGECFQRHSAFRQALALSPTLFDPFLGRSFPGKSAFDRAKALHEADPLRAPLLRWLIRLIDDRIHVPWRRHEADIEMRALHAVREPVEGAFSLGEMRRRALGSRDDVARAWWQSFARGEAELALHRRQLWARHAEVAERLGLPRGVLLRDPTLLDENPLESPESPGALVGLAESLLTQTQSEAQETWGSGFFAHLQASLGWGASEGLPARLTSDSLRPLLYQRELFLGVDLKLGPLPERLAPASFVRAGALVGRALAEALGPRDLPFVVARSPDDLTGHRLGELVGIWMSSPRFAQRRLGLSKTRTQGDARHHRALRLTHARLSATRYLVAVAALGASGAGGSATMGGRAHFEDRYAEITGRAFFEPLPFSSALGRFRARPDEGARFAALLSAERWAADLVETHDEDWYENPRFQEELRANLMRPAERHVSESECTAGLGRIVCAPG